MKKKLKNYQQINKVCKLLVSAIGTMVCLAGCSPRESELLWTEQSIETQEESETGTELSAQDKMNTQVEIGSQGGTDVQAGTDAQETEDGNSQGTIHALDADKSGSDESRILVHVCGAVENPGVVMLEPGSRARDALEAAGGFLEEANRTYVNLAAEVVDGQQLFFPTEEEVDAMETGQILQGAMQGNTVAMETADAKVNINTADENALCTLPGIGTSKAQAIIEYRSTNGTFASIEDIMNVPGIKNSAYEKIQDKITVK